MTILFINGNYDFFFHFTGLGTIKK